MGYMLRNAIGLIKFSLFLPIVLNSVMALMFLVAGVQDDGSSSNGDDDDNGAASAAFGPLFIAVFLGLYARAVWHRIPFAAANLKAAITCVSSNLGMAFLGLAKIPIFLFWIALWSYTFVCVLNSPMMQSNNSDSSSSTSMSSHNSSSSSESDQDGPTAAQVFSGFVLFALVFSFIWTWNVLKNIVHCTLAGTVGTWWFLPQEASSCCSRGLTHSLSRSLTYSFGSICMGSLLVAIIELLRAYIRRLTRNRYAGLLLFCIAECLLSWIESLAQYFNRWAYVYVGVYGYSYIDAGKNVFALFRNRGWTAIISDLLVNRMLGMMSLCVGLINALGAAIFSMGADSVVIFASAFYAFLTGVILSGLVFSVLLSANEAIIVLFAEAPAEFRNNHRELAQEMDDAWRQAWPGVYASSGPVAVGEPV
jgi:hypothetical protein